MSRKSIRLLGHSFTIPVALVLTIGHKADRLLVLAFEIASQVEEAPGDEDQGHERAGVLVVTRGDAATALELLHLMFLHVEFHIASRRCSAVLAQWDSGLHAHGGDEFLQLIASRHLLAAVFSPSHMEEAKASFRQLKLFHVENPLTVRFGNEFFRSLPAFPGVYFFHSRDGELLYIGQSSNLKARIGSYRHVTPEKHPKRILRLVHRVVRIEWRECPTAAEAVELERVLLLEHRPPFNRAGVWQGDPWWLKVEVKDAAIHLELTRDEVGMGPLPSGFRHVLGSLARCLLRAAFGSRPLSEYPHGLFGPRVPLMLVLAVPEADEIADIIRAYAGGEAEPLLAKLESLIPASSSSEPEYWTEEVERLKRFAVKMRSTVARQGPTSDCSASS